MKSTDTAVAVIYARTAVKHQPREDSGLNAQISRCTNHCSENGFEVMKIFCDYAQSSTVEREGLGDLISWLNANKPEQVVVVLDDIARLIRDMKVFQEIKEQLLPAGATLSVAGPQFSTSGEGHLLGHL